MRHTTPLSLALSREIDKINGIIDEKIARGISYALEAQRHKNLLQCLHTLNPQHIGMTPLAQLLAV